MNLNAKSWLQYNINYIALWSWFNSYVKSKVNKATEHPTRAVRQEVWSATPKQHTADNNTRYIKIKIEEKPNEIAIKWDT